MALPPGFPYRNLIVLTAFSVVLGTLVIQGLTLKPLLRALDLRDDDPVGREVSAARARAIHVALASFAGDQSAAAEAVRQEFVAHLAWNRDEADASEAQPAHSGIHRSAVRAAREAVLLMRSNDEIGDDAFHRMEEELDWLEMSNGSDME
jgi:CPA1 family monovalent cation:H+ antiporter